MDNFAAWVDAPTEALIPTPIDDDSSDFLRDEILQTQQFVIDKLDEQKNSEKEASDRTGKESELMRKHKDVMNGESERSEISRVLLVELQKSIRSTDMRLMSMKKKFPVTEPLRETYYKEISELNFSISALARNFTGRENEVKKIVQSAVSLNNKSAEASNLKKLRNSILEAKQKHEKLIAIKKSIRELRAKSQLVHWKKEEESIEAENVLLASNQKKCEILNDESVAIRAEFVQIESAISRQDSVQKENELLAAHTENNRQETLKLIAELRILNENVINERDRIQTTCDENKAVSLIYAEKKDLLINLIKEKLKNEKANAMKDLDMQKKLHELKLAIAKQDGELEKAKEELAGLKSRDFVFESVGELRNKISVMESEVKSQDRKIKEFVKKNVKLTEQIAFLQPPAPPSTPNASRAAAAVATNQVLDTTVDMETDIGEKMTQPYWPGVPRAAIELTPIPFKHMSIDVITGHPLMTSTPRQQPAGIQRPPSGTPMPSPVPNKSTRQTRSAANRLAKNSATRTETIRKKRGGKR